MRGYYGWGMMGGFCWAEALDVIRMPAKASNIIAGLVMNVSVTGKLQFLPSATSQDTGFQMVRGC